MLQERTITAAQIQDTAAMRDQVSDKSQIGTQHLYGGHVTSPRLSRRDWWVWRRNGPMRAP